MAEAAIVTEASIRWLPWIRTKPIVLALAFLTSLLEGVKRPSERRFFSALMKSGIAGGDSVRTERAWSRGGVFVITTARLRDFDRRCCGALNAATEAP